MKYLRASDIILFKDQIVHTQLLFLHVHCMCILMHLVKIHMNCCLSTINFFTV